MRPLLLLLGGVLLAALTPEQSRAVDYPWCAELGSDIGASNCGFVTREPCMATISGIGGFCMPNPSWRAPAQQKPRRRPAR